MAWASTRSEAAFQIVNRPTMVFRTMLSRQKPSRMNSRSLLPSRVAVLSISSPRSVNWRMR